MATEIGRLIATFEADISKFEAGRKQVESGMQKTAQSVNQSQKKIASGELSMTQQLKAAESLQRQRSAALISQWRQQERAARNAALGVRPFRDVLQELSASVATLQGPLGPVSGRISSLGTAITSVTTATGGMLAAFGLTIGAAAGFGAAIFKLASSAANTADTIGDMAAKINFSTRTLSGLETAAHTAGSSLDGLVTALGIFDRNLESAAQGEKRLSELFKGLKIDVTDNEKAFRQMADVLFKLGGTGQQTALAMEVFGRSGKDVLGIIKAADGNVEAFIKSMEELGIVIGEDAVKAADKFDRQITVVKAQIAAVIRQLGEEFIPMVTAAASNLSNWLKANQGEIRKTITEIGNLVKTIVGLADLIQAVSPMVLIVQTVHSFRNLLPGGTTISNQQQQQSVYTQDPVTGRRIYAGNAPFGESGEFAIAGGAGSRSVGAGATPTAGSNALADQVRRLLGRGGGGGGGGGGGRARVDAGVELLKQLERELAQIMPQRIMWEKLMGQEYKNTADSIKKKIYITDIEIQQQKKVNELTRERSALLVRLRRVTEDIGAIVRPRRAEPDIGGIVRPRMVGENIGALTRPRIATDLENALREQYREHMEQIRGLAINVTNILDRAIFDGFEGGLKRGFQSLTLGILDLVKNVFLKRLENILVNAFSGTGGGGGGGLFQRILGTVFGAVAGGFGGGGASASSLSSAMAGGFAGGFQGGGTIPLGSWGTVHDNERVFATPFGAKVVPSSQGGSSPTIIINVPVRSAAAYSSPKSRRQLAEDISAALQGSLA